IDRKWKKLGTRQHLTKEWQLLKQLRKQHYDLVLNLADQWRSALVTRFTGAPVRIGFGFNKRKGHIWSCCHTQLASVSGHQKMHTVEQNLSIFAPFAIPTVSDVKMAWPPTAWQAVENKLKALNVSAPYIIIQPTSRWFFKCWSEEKMAQTICELQQQGFPIILTSGPDEKERAMIAEIQ
ncbi:putative lipopolysaccharide heptosyltransferase III, partial [Teichococcus aestuarii]